MHIALGVGLLKRVHLQSAQPVFLVAVVGAVERPAPYHKGRVAQVLQPHVARMSGHHGGSRPRIGHARCHAPHTVSACRIAHDIHFVGVHPLEGHRHLYKRAVEVVESGFEPHVPVVVGCPGRDVYGMVGSVESFLVVPLLVVELRGCVAAAMERDIEAVAVGGTAAEQLYMEGHGAPADGKVAAVPHGAPLGSRLVFPLLEHLLGCEGGLLAVEPLCRSIPRHEQDHCQYQYKSAVFHLACLFAGKGTESFRIMAPKSTFFALSFCGAAEKGYLYTQTQPPRGPRRGLNPIKKTDTL